MRDNVGPAVADVGGLGEGGAGDDDGIAIEVGFGWEEVVVGAGELEVADGLAAAGEAFGVVEPDAHGDGSVGVEVGGGLAEEGGLERDGVVVGEGAGGEGEARGNGLLVRWVDVVGLADVEETAMAVPARASVRRC